MKKIILSLSIIGAMAAVVVYGTTAYFSDVEQSTGNTFTAGTIDIAVTNPSTWQYSITDMKPGYVDYSNFTVANTGNNPVNVWKKVSNISTNGGTMSEPECIDQGGAWSGTVCTGGTEQSNIDTVITYDLSVVVKDQAGAVKWSQALYYENKTIAEINAMGGDGTFLGMIPVGYTMDVTESYHMLDTVTNWAQGDQMTFDITLTGQQLIGTVILEDKAGAPDWKVDLASPEKATLQYGVKGDKFNFILIGKSPIHSGNVVLVAGYDAGTNPDTLIGAGTTDASGNITMSVSSVELGKDLTNAKVWLIPQGDWDNSLNKVINWNMSQYLWETGMINYYDTNN